MLPYGLMAPRPVFPRRARKGGLSPKWAIPCGGVLDHSVVGIRGAPFRVSEGRIRDTSGGGLETAKRGTDRARRDAMIRFTIGCTVAIGGLGLTALDADAQRLLSLEGIELRGTVRVVEFGAGVCNVIEGSETAVEYERKRANHGQPLDIWQVDVAVYNGSGRWLDHVAARYQVEAAWPPCTNWSEPPAGRYPALEWAGAAGHIQESGRNVVAPRETLSVTHFIIVFHEDEAPKFENWTLQYELGELPAVAVDASAGRSSMAPQAETRGDPATGRGSARARNTGSTRDFGGEDTCAGQSQGASCWMELADQPQCYVWNPNFQSGEIVTWTAECSNGLAQGIGTLRWTHDGGEASSQGLLSDGQRAGHWVVRSANGNESEGRYVAGEREGHWVVRYPSGAVGEGPYRAGQLEGDWVFRYADGRVDEGPYVAGEREGYWVEQRPDGAVQQGSYVDGKAHGSWIVRFPDGRSCQVRFDYGEQMEPCILRRASADRMASILQSFDNGAPKRAARASGMASQRWRARQVSYRSQPESACNPPRRTSQCRDSHRQTPISPSSSCAW